MSSADRKTVCAVHTAMPMVEATKALFSELLPQVRLINVVDDSLIQDVIQAGGVPAPVARRLETYYAAAVEAGADVIFNTCSSVGEIAARARSSLAIPIVRIDEAMARKAVKMGDRVGVLATLPTTLEPTIRLVQEQAAEAGRSLSVVDGLADGAFEALLAGDADTHDARILETARKLAAEVDLIVLAQGSMARMEEALAKATGKPVLSSPNLGVQSVKAVLERQGAV